MKYFVGYLLKDEAAKWHINTAKGISDKFNTWKIYEKLPPHITIFYLGDTENVSNIKDFLRNWAERVQIPGNFYLSGFGRFDDRVVFAKVEADRVVVELVEGLRTKIKEISGITREDFPDWHPHSTLAKELTSEEIHNIWSYTTNLEDPDFTLPFDRVTIFKSLGGKKWMADESFRFLGGASRPRT